MAATYKPALPLTEIELEFFHSVVKFLKKNKAIEIVDTYQITQLAKCWGRYHHAEMMLHNNPDMLIQTFESGAENLGTYYIILERERSMFDKLARNFGLNQKAREALLAFKVEANQPGGIISKLRKIRDAEKRAI